MYLFEHKDFRNLPRKSFMALKMLLNIPLWGANQLKGAVLVPDNGYLILIALINCSVRPNPAFHPVPVRPSRADGFPLWSFFTFKVRMVPVVAALKG